jgi:glycosyltransferase involved in cell wall biosynthesis
MRIVFNRYTTLGARTGIGHFSAELLAALVASPAEFEIDSYPTGWMWSTLARVMAPAGGGAAPAAGKPLWRRGLQPALNLVRRSIQVPAVRGGLRTVLLPARDQHFRAYCKRQRFDLYHEPNFLPMACDAPTIATLHDLSALAHPEWHPADRVRQHQRHLARALSQATHFLTGSDFTRAEIVRELGVPPQRVTRVYHGVRGNLAPMPSAAIRVGLQRLGLPSSYLLHVGTLEPRKNLELLLRAYCQLPDKARQACPLLLVGKWGWNTAGLADYLHGEARHRGVMHLGYLAEDDLCLVYNGARALVYPSLYEGFGLPPVEMMACGGAALVSTAGSVTEVVGPHGCAIEARDLQGWRDAMQRVIDDDDWHRQLRLGVREWSAQFTWQRAAQETLNAYRAVLDVRPAVPQAA